MESNRAQIVPVMAEAVTVVGCKVSPVLIAEIQILSKLCFYQLLINLVKDDRVQSFKHSFAVEIKQWNIFIHFLLFM